MNPVNWWHKQEGGKIAEERPAPPGADAPYPNIATVPAKPEAPDAEALKKLTDSLVADRTNAQHAAQAAPLADPSQPGTSPGLFGVGTAPPLPPPSAPAPSGSSAPAASGSAPPPSGAAASASMPAVTAPPAPVQPPSPAPRKAVQSAPLEAPPAPPAGAPPATAAAAPPPQPQPDLPAAPPPRPSAAGAPPPPPVVPAPMPAAAGISSASIVFVEGAASLAPPAADEVRAFAAKRGNGVIVVTGYGDAPASDPAAQSAALTLGLSRAQSVFDVLKAAGVPAEAIRVNAEASGRGATLRLLQ